MRYCHAFTAGLLITLAIAPASAQPLPRCTPEQLDIRLLARETPGMMHERWLFGVINRGRRVCDLPAQVPQLLVGDKTINIAATTRPGSGRLALSPNGKRSQLAASRIVWFSIDLTHAEAPDFTRLDIRLALPARHDFPLTLSGNHAEIRQISPLRRDLRHSFDGVAPACDEIAGWRGADWTVETDRTVHCD
jgi:hypothetical protein